GGTATARKTRARRKPPAGSVSLLEAVGLSEKATGDPVHNLQSFLTRFGYLQTSPDPESAVVHGAGMAALTARAGTFDTATVPALRHSQRFHGLPVTGQLDLATATQMAVPRCGVPDVPRTTASLRSFVAPGNRWPKQNLTYAFENFTNKLN